MIRKTILAAVAAVSLCFSGCNALATAQKAHDIIGAVLTVATNDIQPLESAGVLTQDEATIASSYVALGVNLNAQYGTCIAASGNNKAKLVACVNAFGAGLQNPSELAQLRVLSPKAQAQVQLWASAAIIALNSVVAALQPQSAPLAAPQIAGSLPTRRAVYAWAQARGVHVLL